jgi:PAS domain S-box-containing protein
MLKTAAEQNIDGIIVMDAGGSIQFVNDAWLHLHGLGSLGELPQHQRADFFEGFIKKTDGFNGEVTHIRKDGTKVQAWLSAMQLKNADGSSAGMVNIVRDMSACKRVLAELSEKNQLLGNLFQNAGEGILVTDQNGYITMANDMAGQMLGYGVAELTGKHIADLTLYQDGGSYNPYIMKQLFEKERIHDYELDFIRKDGSRFPAAVNIVFFRHEGEVAGSATSIRDISDRKRIMHELEKKNLFMEKLFQSAGDGIIVTNSSGFITLGNERAAQMLGYEVDELTRKHVSDICRYEEGSSHEADIFKHLPERGRLDNCEFVFIRSDGSQFPAEVNIALFPDNDDGGLGAVTSIRDSTERKRVMRELQEKNLFMENLFRSSGEGILVTDDKGYISMLNAKAAALLGYDPDELRGRHFIDISFGDYQLGSNPPLMDELLATGSISDYEIMLIRKDGSVFPAEINIVLLRGEGGAIIGGISSIRDITDRKRVLQELKNKTFFLENIFRTTGESMIVTNAEGYIIRANRMTEEIFGYRESELVGRHFAFLGPEPLSLDTMPPSVQNLVEGKSFRNYESRLKRKDGTVFPTESNIAVLKDELGTIIGAITSIRDITERKESEKALQESEKKYRTIFETVQDVFYQTDLEGTIHEISPSILRHAGYSREEILGGEVKSIIFYERPEDRERFVHDLQKNGELLDYEMRLRAKDGSTKYASVNAYFVYEDDTPVRITGCMRDITERKQVEMELQKRDESLEAKAAELEEVNSALKVLLKKTEEAKQEMEEKILFNVQELVGTYIDKLKRTTLSAKQQTYLTILESNLHNIVSPFGQKLSVKYAGMTPAEIQVANLIREGKTTKEMSEILNSSERTIDFHRKNIRNKLGIKNQKANLRSLLLSLQ